MILNWKLCRKILFELFRLQEFLYVLSWNCFGKESGIIWLEVAIGNFERIVAKIQQSLRQLAITV